MGVSDRGVRRRPRFVRIEAATNRQMHMYNVMIVPYFWPTSARAATMRTCVSSSFCRGTCLAHMDMVRDVRNLNDQARPRSFADYDPTRARVVDFWVLRSCSEKWTVQIWSLTGPLRWVRFVERPTVTHLDMGRKRKREESPPLERTPVKHAKQSEPAPVAPEPPSKRRRSVDPVSSR